MPLSDVVQLQVLQHYFQGCALPTISQSYLALHRSDPGGDNQGVGETTYAGYTRLSIAPSPSTFLVSPGPPARAQNATPLAFPPCVGAGDTVSFWSLGLNQSGPGALIAYGPIVGSSDTLRGFAGYAGSPAVLFVPNLPYGTQVNDLVTLQQMGPGMLLPLGLVEGQLYYVGTVNVVTGNVTLSLALDNAAPADATGAGNGFYYPTTPMIITQGNVPTFPPNSLLTFQG